MPYDTVDYGVEDGVATPLRRAFMAIASKDGLKAAIAWRDARFAGRRDEAFEPEE